MKSENIVRFTRRTLLAGLTFLGILGAAVSAEDLKRVQEPEFAAEAVREVEIVKDGETALEITYEPQENKGSYAYWTMRVPYDSSVIMDTERMYSFFGMLAELDLSDAALEGAEQPDSVQPDSGEPDAEQSDAGSADAEQSDAGSTDAEQPDAGSAETSIRVRYLDGQQGQSGQAEPDSELKLLVQKQDNGYTGYLEGFEDRVFTLDSKIMDAVLFAEPYQMILKITHLVDIGAISEMQAGDGQKTLILKKDGEELLINGEKSAEDDFNQIYMQFMSVLVTGAVPEDYVPDENREAVLTLTYTYADGENTETVQYFPYDDNSCSVNVNGKEFFLVDKTEVENLTGLLER